MTFWFIPSEMYKDAQAEDGYARTWAYLEGRPEGHDRLKCPANAVRYPMWDVDVETMALVRGRLEGTLV